MPLSGRRGPLGLELEDVPIGTHVAGHGAREMGADDQDGSVSAISWHVPSRLRGNCSVRIGDLRQVRQGHLAGMVNEIAGDQTRLILERIRTLACPGVCPGVETSMISSVTRCGKSIRSTRPASNSGGP